ncbi:aminotransferase-like domain-containing protein [Actinomycetospora soli]|uniref:aminotransferase-like domain-containing protein n=1 Tax=Actinomycetospora soli TaxID=2893887 RepID=UPI001E54E18B|nr:PLP-dependent aminotransferase family protein [Actinomycetospora soli]MCD2190293.1 PLP-dependent aminotransferase family protein [Actinomycetospora soli]
MLVALDRSAPTPLAVQVADGLRGAALDGRLRVGERVPATRVLARELGVSRTVTAAAYDQLVAEGWLGARHGSGTFVLAAPSGAAPRGSDASSLPPGDSNDALLPPGGGAATDLRPGSPCLEVLDTASWRRAWRRAGDLDPAARPEYAGVPAFRAAVSEHLLRHRGLVGADVLATAGTTAGLTELVALLTRRLGRPVRAGFEDPGYRRAAGVLRAAGAEVIALAVDAEGVVVGNLPAGLDLVYVTPAHQYPLGGRLPVARRAALVERARAEGFVLVEDDYDGELRYDVAPLPVLAALGPDVVVHLGTAGKIATPDLGVGWLVAPPALAAELLAQRRTTGTRPAPAGQQVLAAWVHDGGLGRHLTRLRRELRVRRGLVVDAVRAAGHGVLGDRAGAHLVVPLPSAALERGVVDAAGGAGVLLDGLAAHHLDDTRERRSGVLVGWAAPSRTELGAALERVRGVLAGAAAGPA